MQLALVQPPITRATEPPVGLARLAAALRPRGHEVALFDANIQAQRYLMDAERLRETKARCGPAPSKRLESGDQRAIQRIEQALAQLNAAESYQRDDIYTGAVRDLAAALRLASRPYDPAKITPADFSEGLGTELGPAEIRSLFEAPELCPFTPYFEEALLPQIVAAQPRIVGLSVLYRGQLGPALALARLLRDALPGTHLCIGGSLGTSWVQARERAPAMDDLLRAVTGCVDSVIWGEGEVPLLALCDAVAGLSPWERKPAQPVPGSLQIVDDALVAGPEPSSRRLDDVATGDFRGLDVESAGYFTPELVIPLTGSRGCYWGKCAFCPETALPEDYFRPRGAEALMAEMRLQHARHGAEFFHLIDDAIPPRVLIGLADLIAESGLPFRWYGFARAEKQLLRPETCERLYAGGCRMLELGLESGCDRLLELFAKGIPVAQAEAVLHNLKAAGIGTFVYILFGIPSETEEEARMTVDFVARNSHLIDFLHTSVFRLTRDSLIERDAERFGIRFVDDSVSEAGSGQPQHRGFAGGGGMDNAQVRRFIKDVYRAHPQIHPIELRTPPVFGASHGPFRPGAPGPAAYSRMTDMNISAMTSWPRGLG